MLHILEGLPKSYRCASNRSMRGGKSIQTPGRACSRQMQSTSYSRRIAGPLASRVGIGTNVSITFLFHADQPIPERFIHECRGHKQDGVLFRGGSSAKRSSAAHTASLVQQNTQWRVSTSTCGIDDPVGMSRLSLPSERSEEGKSKSHSHPYRLEFPACRHQTHAATQDAQNTTNPVVATGIEIDLVGKAE